MDIQTAKINKPFCDLDSLLKLNAKLRVSMRGAEEQKMMPGISFAHFKYGVEYNDVTITRV